MKLNVADIPDEGLHFKGQFDHDIFELSENDDYKVLQNVKYDFKVRDLASVVFCEGTLYAPFEGRCPRCLEAFPVHIVIPEWSADYPTEFEDEDEEAAEAAPVDGVIDLEARIREDLLLQLPSQCFCEDYIEDRECPGESDAHFESTEHTERLENDTWAALDGLNQEKSD